MGTYALRSLTRAKNAADILIKSAVSEGIELRRSEALEVTARLMLFENWAALVKSVAEDPAEGIDDAELPDEVAESRRKEQVALLRAKLAINDDTANAIIVRMHPTGRDTSANWEVPAVLSENHDLYLTPDDLELRERLCAIAKEVDRHGRRMLRALPLDSVYISPVERPLVPEVAEWEMKRAEDGVRESDPSLRPPENEIWAFDRDKAHRSALARLDIWRKALSNGGLETASAAEAAARECVAQLLRAIVQLGPIPHISPMGGFSLELRRLTYQGSRGTYLDPIERLPYLTYRRRWTSLRSSNIEGHAPAAISQYLGLRRAFLDGGWAAGGKIWLVTFRTGGDSRETTPIVAPDAGKAVAWTCAARSARLLQQYQGKPTFRILSVDSEAGPIDVSSAVLAARQEQISNGPLLSPDRVCVPTKLPSKRESQWEVLSRGNSRAVLMRNRNHYESGIAIVRDDLGGQMGWIEVPHYDGSSPEFMGQQNAPMELFRQIADEALNGLDPWQPGGVAHDTAKYREDLAERNEGWNRFLKVAEQV